MLARQAAAGRQQLAGWLPPQQHWGGAGWLAGWLAADRLAADRLAGWVPKSPVGQGGTQALQSGQCPHLSPCRAGSTSTSPCPSPGTGATAMLLSGSHTLGKKCMKMCPLPSAR